MIKPMLVMCLIAACAAPAAGAATPPPAKAKPAAAAPSRPAADPNAPGAEHAKLAALVGHWTTVYRVIPMPGAEEIAIPGTAEYRSTLGGLWIVADTDLRMGEASIRGLAIYGYDKVKKKYSFQFMQQADTQLLFGLGTPDSSGDVITYDVPMDIPMAGLMAVPTRTVLTFESADRHVVEMFQRGPDGAEFRPVRIEYTRAK